MKPKEIEERNYHIFGDDNAEDDQLLYKCPVLPGTAVEGKPILIGRWGTGKTALLLLQNKELEAVIREMSPSASRVWYISEHSLDIDALVSLQKELNDRDRLLAAIQRLWHIELLRVFSILLGILRERYKQNSGNHWAYIRVVEDAVDLKKTVWNEIPTVLASILNRDPEPIRRVRSNIDRVLDARTYISVLKCLSDIGADEVVPTVVVEPIETPTARLEAVPGLAQLMITGLLNTFHRDFRPGLSKNLSVRISIPWHRYDKRALNFPQKLFTHRGFIRWTRPKLREFINARILKEYERVGRKHPKGGRDAWASLFEERMANPHCNPIIFEQSFDLIIRHTHFRPRDLQRYARDAVEKYGDSLEVSYDDVLRGRHDRINADAILAAVRDVGLESADDLIIEGDRRFPGLATICNILRALPAPFSTDDLAGRIASHRDMLEKHRVDTDFNEVVRRLWSAGLIGIVVDGVDPGLSTLLEGVNPDGKQEYVNEKGKRVEVWTWFEYNFDARDGSQLLETLVHMGVKNEQVKLLLHPKTFPRFGPMRYSDEYPLGV